MEFIFPVIFGFVCATVFLLYINGYLDLLFLIIRNYKLINKIIKEFHITSDMLNQYISIFNNNQSIKQSGVTTNIFAFMLNKESDTSKNETYISKSGKCIHIYYNYVGTEYMLTVPYNGLSSVDMIQYQVDCIYESGDSLIITQQPGIPYLVNANDLSCTMLKAINCETDAFHEYKNFEIPHFCTEICDG